VSVLTLVEGPGGVSIDGVQQGGGYITPAGDHIVGGHEPERDQGQNDASIAWKRVNISVHMFNVPRIQVGNFEGGEGMTQWGRRLLLSVNLRPAFHRLPNIP